MKECTCKFIARGKPMKNNGCLIHKNKKYPCNYCPCEDYRPQHKMKNKTMWAKCICKHIAQEHD